MEIFSPGWGGTRVSFFAAGVNLRRTGRLEDAEEYSLEYRSVFDQTAEHPQDPKSQFGEFLLARARLLRGELSPQEALPVIEAFVAAKEKTYYSTFYGLGLTAKMLCLIRLGRFTDAEALVGGSIARRSLSSTRASATMRRRTSTASRHLLPERNAMRFGRSHESAACQS
jgi:hypothetical protein